MPLQTGLGRPEQPREPSDPAIPGEAAAGDSKQPTPEKLGLAESGSLKEQGSEDPPKRKRLGWGQGLARLQSKDVRLSGTTPAEALFCMSHTLADSFKRRLSSESPHLKKVKGRRNVNHQGC